MRNLSACFESLENRRMFAVTPTVVATFPGGINPQIVAGHDVYSLDSSDIYGTTPATNSSGGSVFVIRNLSSTPDILGTFNSGTGSSNALGSQPRDILVDGSGNLCGDNEAGGADASQQSSGATGGTLWGLGVVPGSQLQLQTPLSFSSVSGLSRDIFNGNVFGLGAVDGTGGSTTSVFEYTPGAPVIPIGTVGLGGQQTPVAVLPDSGGNGFILYSNYPKAGSSLTILPTGDYTATGTTFNPFTGLGAVQPTGMVFDGVNDLFITCDGSASTPGGLVEVKAGALTGTVLGTWTSSTMPGLEHPVLDGSGNVFAIAYDPSDASAPAALVVLPAGHTQFETVMSLSSATALTGLTITGNTPVGVMGNSVVQFPSASTLLLGLSTLPVITTFSAFEGNLAIDSTGNIFGTTAATNTSAGSIIEIPAGTSAVQTLATFGTNDVTTNTLGISPAGLMIDAQGDLYGVCQSGGPDYSANILPDPPDPQAPGYPTGGTLWELPSGSSSIKVLAPLYFSRVNDITMDSSGDVFGIEETDGAYAETSSIGSFSWTPAGGLQFISRANLGINQPLPIAITTDGAGNAYLVEKNLDQGPQTVYEFSPGTNTQSTPTSSQPFGSYNGVMTTGVTMDAAGDLFLTYGSGIIEVKAGTQTAVPLAALPAGSSGVSPITLDSEGDVYAVSSTGPVPSIIELPVGQTSFKNILTLTTADSLSDLLPDSKGNLYLVDNNSLVELTGVGTVTLPPITPAPTKGLSPAILTDRIPPTALAEARVTGVARLQLKPLAEGASTGIATTTLYAVSETDTIKLAHISQRYKSGAASLNSTIRFAARLSAGTYTIIAQTVDAAGNTVNSASGGTITVAVRVQNVVASLTAISSTVTINRSGIARVLLTSTGNVPATGPLTLSITTDGYTIAGETIHIRNLKTRASIRVKIKIPPSMPSGTYAPTLSTNWDGTAETQASQLFLTVI